MSTAMLPAGPAAKRPSGLNPRLVAHAVRRRPLAFAGLALAAAGAAAGIWFFLPLPKMTAVVGFSIAPPQSVIRGSANVGSGEMAAFRIHQATQVRYRVVLSRILNEPGVKDLPSVRAAEPDPLTWLERALKPDLRSTGTDAFRILVEGDDPDELKALLTAVSRAYLKYIDDQENGGRRQQYNSLKAAYETLQADADKFYARMDALQRSVGGPTPLAQDLFDLIHRSEAQQAAAKLSDAQQRLEMSRSTLRRLDEAQNPAAAPPPVNPAFVGPPAPAPAARSADAWVDLALRNDPNVHNLEEKVQTRRQALDRAKERYTTPTAIDVKKAEKEVRAAEDLLAKYRAARRPELVEEFKQTQQAHAAQGREQVRAAVEQAQVDIKLAEEHLASVGKKADDRNVIKGELDKLRRDGEAKMALAAGMRRQMEELNVDLTAPLRVSKGDEPFVLPGLEGNRRLKYSLIAGVGVFVLGFGALVGWEFRGRRVTHTDDATTDLGVRLLGTVPPSGSDGLPGAPPAALAEAVDTARTMLLHGTPDGPAMRTVLITSGVAGEGKTSLAGHLSISLARAGYRTVLVDGDLQSPSAHRLFDCPVGPGLCELLRDQVGLDDAARPTPIPGLAILPAGRWDTAARQSLVGDRWRRLKTELEGRYDFVVIDSAPLLLVSDTLLLAREADGVVLSVLLGVSQVSHVAESAGRLQAVGAKLTGAVVNGVWHKAYRTGNAYRYAAAAPAGAAVLTAADGE